jgi:dTDP-4-dehydrorhamnose reductase
MRVVVFGSSGIIGRAVCQTLVFDQVTAFDRHQVDITAADEVRSAMASCRPDLVFNCTGLTDREMGELNEHQFRRVNALAVEALAQECRRRKAVLIQFSPPDIYPASQLFMMGGFGHTESEVVKEAANAYGRTKVEAENLIRQTTDLYYIIRTSWVFGPGRDNPIDTLIGKIRNNELIEADSTHHGRPTYAFDLVRAAAQVCRARLPFGEYHLTNQGIATQYMIAKYIIEMTQSDSKIVPMALPTYPPRPQSSILHTVKTVPVMRQWKTALKEYLVGLCDVSPTHFTSLVG